MIIRDGILVKTVRYVRVQSLSFHAYRIYLSDLRKVILQQTPPSNNRKR